MPLYGTNFVSLFRDQIITGIKNFIQNLGLGISNPQAKLHIDAGSATASAIKFTAGATTGQTAADGFNIGISSTGAAIINQLENNSLTFFTNNTSRMSIDAGGDLYLGRNANILATTASTSTTTGALVIAGGVGIGTALNCPFIKATFLEAYQTTCQIYVPPNAAGINTSGANIDIRGGIGTGNANSGNIIFSTGVPTTSGTALQSWTEKARISGNTGNLLVGTNVDNGSDRLQINGSIKADLAADSTVFSISQNSGVRSVIFGNQGLICNTVATLGRSTRGGGALLEINTASPGLVGILIQAMTGQTADLQQWRDSSNNILARVDNLGRVVAPQFRLSALNTPPTSATDTGTSGEIRIDANFIYVCITTNTWKRAALTTW